MPAIKITKKDATSLFLALAFHDAATWDDAKWAKRIDKLAAQLAAPEALTTMTSTGADEYTIGLAKELRKSIKADPKTVFTIGTPDASPAKAEKPAEKTEAKPAKKAEAAKSETKKTEAPKTIGEKLKAAKKNKTVEQPILPGTEKAVAAVKKPAKAAPAPEPKKTKAELAKKTVKGEAYSERFERVKDFPITGGRDKFGYRNGSMAAVVNAMLIKAVGEDGPKAVKTDKIVEKTQVKRYRVTDHMWAMIKNGFAKKTDDGAGYILTAKGAKVDYSQTAEECPAPGKKAKAPAEKAKK